MHALLLHIFLNNVAHSVVLFCYISSTEHTQRRQSIDLVIAFDQMISSSSQEKFHRNPDTKFIDKYCHPFFHDGYKIVYEREAWKQDQGKALMQCGMEEKMQRTEGTMRVFWTISNESEIGSKRFREVVSIW